MADPDLSSEDVDEILGLDVDDEYEDAEGAVWTRLPDNDDGEGEWKYSPHGADGDYDTDCSWYTEEEIEDLRASAEGLADWEADDDASWRQEPAGDRPQDRHDIGFTSF